MINRLRDPLFMCVHIWWHPIPLVLPYIPFVQRYSTAYSNFIVFCNKIGLSQISRTSLPSGWCPPVLRTLIPLQFILFVQTAEDSRTTYSYNVDANLINFNQSSALPGSSSITFSPPVCLFIIIDFSSTSLSIRPRLFCEVPR